MARRSAKGRRARPGTVGSPPLVVSGPGRADHRTKDLVNRLEPGDVAVIDHEDIDRIAGESLAGSGIVAVVNAAASTTGKYPNEGPLVVLDAGIVLVDGCGPAVMSVAEGSEVVIDGDRVLVDGELVATGRRQSRPAVERVHAASNEQLEAEFIRFIDNTMTYVDDNLDLLSDDFVVPDVGVSFEGRHVLLVVRGHDYREDLALIRSTGYVAEMRPVLVAVDGGADALLEHGLSPDVIVGDFDSVSERALRSGAVLVVHAYRDGRAPGAQRLEEMGLPFILFPASGTSEDIAMLMAYEHGAELIVAVGTHTSMVDFLDKGRRGMASTVITRMKVGPILVDAKGVSRLYKNRIRKRDIVLMVLAALIALAVLTMVSEPIRLIIRAYWTDFTN
jgi:uncharacterized membrane-anchored protein